MNARLAVLLTLLLALPAHAAEIYTFGKGSNGRRYVKHVDRPVAARQQEDSTDTRTARPPSPNRQGQTPRRAGPPVPPPIDPRALKVLDEPIM